MSYKYEPPPIHDLNAEEQEYLKSLTPREFALHKVAVEKLGSSYFVWKSHGFQAWKNDKKNNVVTK
jgi:hypothetical protein